MNRRPTEPKAKTTGFFSKNPLRAKLEAAARDAESRPAREPSQADLDRHSRRQGVESRAAEAAMRERRAMERSGTDGFKDTTRMRYMQGGDVAGYAKGGSVKGAAKISKVMGEFKRGELHSGSKKGPEVTSKKQATAIALSEARKAGAKIPVKKAMGGAMTAMPPAAMPGHSDAGSDLMKKGGPVKKAMGGAMNARKQALAARASAASNEARNAQMARRPVAPKRGPAGAGFAAKPMVGKSMPPMGPMVSKSPSADKTVVTERLVSRPLDSQPMVSKSPSADNTVVTERMVQAPPTSMTMPMIQRHTNMKRGGLTAMPKGKKC